MADLATELANLNVQAAELLAKYNGAFEKLDEETQNKITLLQDKAAELQTQIESLGFKFDENGILVKEDGSEISVGNALKLGGKSLDEINLNLTFVKWSTNLQTYSISDPGPNVWFELPDFKITIPEDGTYFINVVARMWGPDGSADRWWKSKITINGNDDNELVSFAFNLYSLATNSDLSQSFSGIKSLKTGDVLQVHGYVYNHTGTSISYGDSNGNSSILAIKIGE